MSNSPEDIIAITIKRYLKPPVDTKFWKDYKNIEVLTPENLKKVIARYVDIEEFRNRLMQPADELLFSYILALDGQASFPINETIEEYSKKFFTPDDDDFYNRVIYENQILQLKEEINGLNLKLNEAVDARDNFIKRDYEWIRKLGSGGFGNVSLVKHILSDQFFAIKSLKDVDEAKQEIILKEIRALASLNHQNIIGYRNSFSSGSVLYLVMEYCAKGTLDNKIEKLGKLSEDEIITLFLQLTKTFGYIHKKKIIHHDIKPSNILFDGDGNIKISDFGCVNTDIGTRAYLPPEFYEKNNYSPNVQTDIFALGVTLMETAIGYNPFWDKTPDEKNKLIKNANLPIDNLSYWLQNTILKAVHYDVSSRFATMEEFHKAIEKRNIPQLLNKELLSLEKDANRLAMLVKTKKWIKAKTFVEAYPFIRKNLNLSLNAGTLYLNIHQVQKAKEYFENALELNPHTNLEKLIAEVYLQSGHAVKASSILTGYINRNFNDIEAHVQLLYSYYLSERWELGYGQSKLLLDVFSNEDIIKNNHAVFCYLLNKINDLPDTNFDESFGQYNWQIFSNNNPQSWYKTQAPSLCDKLIFQEYKFRHISGSTNKLELKIDGTIHKVSDLIISFGRTGYEYNTFYDFEGTSVSRRHFIIINMKNNVWLYDLNSTGVYVDGKRVNQKAFLLGLHTIKFGNYEIELKTDDKILL